MFSSLQDSAKDFVARFAGCLVVNKETVMLYRPRRHLTALAIFGKGLSFIVGALSAFPRVGQDAAHLDTLRDGELRDLGVRRIDDRGVRYYR